MDRTIHHFQDRTDIWIVRSTISRIGLNMDRRIHYFQDRTDSFQSVFHIILILGLNSFKSNFLGGGSGGPWDQFVVAGNVSIVGDIERTEAVIREVLASKGCRKLGAK